MNLLFWEKICLNNSIARFYCLPAMGLVFIISASVEGQDIPEQLKEVYRKMHVRDKGNFEISSKITDDDGNLIDYPIQIFTASNDMLFMPQNSYLIGIRNVGDKAIVIPVRDYFVNTEQLRLKLRTSENRVIGYQTEPPDINIKFENVNLVTLAPYDYIIVSVNTKPFQSFAGEVELTFENKIFKRERTRVKLFEHAGKVESYLDRYSYEVIENCWVGKITYKWTHNDSVNEAYLCEDFKAFKTEIVQALSGNVALSIKRATLKRLSTYRNQICIKIITDLIDKLSPEDPFYLDCVTALHEYTKFGAGYLAFEHWVKIAKNNKVSQAARLLALDILADFAKKEIWLHEEQEFFRPNDTQKSNGLLLLKQIVNDPEQPDALRHEANMLLGHDEEF